MPRHAVRLQTLVLLVVCLCLWTPSVASAQADAVERYLTAASRLYENLEYERALEQLKRAKSISGRTVDDDVAIALYEGIILADLGKKEDSISAFKEGLYLKPDAKLPVRVSPKVVSNFEGVRREVKKELAPILARQEAEKKRREEEARKLADAQKRADEDKAKADAEARRKAADARAKEDAEARARRAAEDKARQQNADRPEKDRVIVVQPDGTAGRQPDFIPGSQKKVERGLPVAPIVLGGIAVAAGGVGAFFGLQSKSQLQQAQGAQFQDETVRLRNSAADSALIANIAFAAAAAAGIGALVTAFVGSGDNALPPRANSSDGAGAGYAE